MSAALHQIIVFIGILVGFFCRKGKILTEESTSTCFVLQNGKGPSAFLYTKNREEETNSKQKNE